MNRIQFTGTSERFLVSSGIQRHPRISDYSNDEMGSRNFTLLLLWITFILLLLGFFALGETSHSKRILAYRQVECNRTGNGYLFLYMVFIIW